MQQRRPGPLGAGDLGRRQRRGTVVLCDHHRPIDDGVAAESGGAVAARRGRGAAAQPDVGAHQALGADEVDPEPGEFGRRLLEEQVGALDIELDGGRVLGLGEARQHVDDLTRAPGSVDDRRHQHVEVIAVAGELDGERGGLPHVVRRAPPAGVELVDELDRDLPGVERIVGDDQAQTRQDDRFAERPAVVALEAGGQRVHRREMRCGPPSHDRVGVGQGLENGSRGRGGRPPIGRQIGIPPLADESVAGEAVDERGVDVGDRGLGVAGEADLRRDRFQGRQRVDEGPVGDRPPAPQPEASLLDDNGRELAGGDGGGGEPGDGDEPREGVPAAPSIRGARAARGRRGPGSDGG